MDFRGSFVVSAGPSVLGWRARAWRIARRQRRPQATGDSNEQFGASRARVWHPMTGSAAPSGLICHNTNCHNTKRPTPTAAATQRLPHRRIGVHSCTHEASIPSPFPQRRPSPSGCDTTRSNVFGPLRPPDDKTGPHRPQQRARKSRRFPEMGPFTKGKIEPAQISADPMGEVAARRRPMPSRPRHEPTSPALICEVCTPVIWWLNAWSCAG